MDSGAVTRDQLGKHHFVQPAEGPRLSTDSVLLAHFAPRVSGPVADLGAGCGVLCQLLWQRGLPGPYTAVEIDPLAAQCCQINLHRAGVPARVLEADLRLPHPRLAGGSFRLLVSNPPYGQAGSGRLPPAAARARARHGLTLPAPALWQRAAGLLAPGGRLAISWPSARLNEALGGLGRQGLHPRRLQMVRGKAGREPAVVLIEALLDQRGPLRVEPEMVVHGDDGAFTPRVKAIYRELCLL